MNRSDGKLRRSVSCVLLGGQIRNEKNSTSVDCTAANGTFSATRDSLTLRDVHNENCTLRRENFNLKLELFLLREHMNRYTPTEGNGYDMKYEVEQLRKETQAKKLVLLEAVEAITCLESSYKKLEKKYKNKVEQLEQKIYLLQTERTLKR